MIENQLIIKLKDTIVMEIAKNKLRKFSVLSMIFAKNMIRKLHACPFVSQTGVSTAIGNGL